MTAFLGSATLRLVAILIVVLGLMGAGAYIDHRLEADKYDRRVAQDAQAQAKAVSAALELQRKLGADAVAAAQAEAATQSRLSTEADLHQQEIVKYVPVTRVCVPYGLVRVLNAAAGLPAASVSRSAGKSDDACAPVSWRDVARSIIADYATGRANAAQQDALIGFLRTARGEVK